MYNFLLLESYKKIMVLTSFESDLRWTFVTVFNSNVQVLFIVDLGFNCRVESFFHENVSIHLDT